ncbi:hypothetical protein, partial [uncultured Pseudoalteromonas sp.]|uniref:hypothetical protein n=1 Tax=uncultured Pseudoalteromonas sp. TaxID=114053 RepID=UPI0030FC2A3F
FAASSAAKTCTLENIGIAAITAKPRVDFFMDEPYLLKIYLNGNAHFYKNCESENSNLGVIN